MTETEMPVQAPEEDLPIDEDEGEKALEDEDEFEAFEPEKITVESLLEKLHRARTELARAAHILCGNGIVVDSVNELADELTIYLDGK